MEQLKFLTKNQIEYIAQNFELPIFVYSQTELEKYGNIMLNFPNEYWLTVRFAMKSNPNMNILKIFNNIWIHIDASSEFEVYRALNAWIPGNHIQLTAQEFPRNLKELLEKWIFYNATSLHQLEEYGKLAPTSNVSVRINPWLGSWATNRTNVWWPSSSFGIWYEYLDQINEIAKKYNLKITKIHTHIWSWSDPQVWANVSVMSLNIVKHFPDVETLNLWWWFKVARMEYELSADILEIWEQVKQNFINFYNETGKRLKLEIEPWTFLVANTSSLITKVQDIVDTWNDWYKFIKLNTWMTEITRPSLYGAQHPIIIINNRVETADFVITWHCCESWDILTPAQWDPEWILPRKLNIPEIWDIVIIEWTWSYCSAMSTKNYNSFPEVGELLIKNDWTILEIRKRQSVNEIWKNEINVF